MAHCCRLRCQRVVVSPGMSLNQVSVQPNSVGFKVPSDGKTGTVRLKVNNASEDRMMFKMKLTNPDMFAVGPPYGFVPAKGHTLIKIKPKKFDESKNFVPTDHFSVIVGAAPNIEPPAQSPTAQECWKKGSEYEPVKLKKYVVNIVYCKGAVPLPPVISEAGEFEPGLSSQASETVDDGDPKGLESEVTTPLAPVPPS